MIEANIERVNQLMATSRYKEADAELSKLLGQFPDNTVVLSMLALCTAQLGNLSKAHQLIGHAIGKEPDNAHLLYIQSNIFLQDENLFSAEKSIKNAIAYEPTNSTYFGTYAQILIGQRKWEAALQAANEGLALDPSDLVCLNSRSTSLFKLDRKDEAYKTVEKTLTENPENEYTHANLGWAFLEQRDYKKALEHFRESLRLDPQYEYAKSGLVEALKARYLFYRWFLGYVFWVSNMKKAGQWALLIGLYVGVKILQSVRDSNPELGLILTPIITLYMIFAFSTWIIGPLSNLALRLNVYGRYALSESQVTSSNFVGISLLLSILGGMYFLLTADLGGLGLLIFGLSMMIPLGSMLNARGTGRAVLVGSTALLAIIGTLVIVEMTINGQVGSLATIYIFGIVVYSWAANAFMMR